MGSGVDSHRIDKVLRNHRDELVADLWPQGTPRLIKRYSLYHATDAIGVVIHLKDGSAIDIGKYWEVDALMDRFPECA